MAIQKEIYKKGMQFGDWKLLKYINGGGNGAVWIAEKNKDLKAIKLLKNVNKKTITRFRDEIKVIDENKETKGILPIIDYHLSDDTKETSWYVMPIASGIVDHTKSMRNEEKIDLIINIGEVLVELHQKEIKHRDIKPGNILFYENEYYLADFGLVDYPEKEDVTAKFESVGPKWTMAPEMRRNPQTADAKKSDVYSLAKTMWILLTGESLGFDGQYSSTGRNSLNRYDSYLFSGPLDTLLIKSTSDDPNDRPTMKEFVEALKLWKVQNHDFQKRNPYEWQMIQEQLFPMSIPNRVVWENKNDIINVLNLVGSIPSLNHIFYPRGGGMDLLGATIANEPDCIVLNTGFKEIIKPKRLLFESIGKDTQWNYFRLELDSLTPIYRESPLGYEQLIETEDGYEEYHEELTGKSVIRYINEGAIVIFQKTSIYNNISETYDGRHSKMNTEQFKTYIERLEQAWSMKQD